MGEDLQLVKQDGDMPTPTGDGNSVKIRKKSGPPRLEVERQRFLAWSLLSPDYTEGVRGEH